MTTTQQYYFDKVAPRGSSLHYSLISTPKQKRTAILALHSLCHELNHILQHYNEKSIAQTKLLWWQQEIQRAFEQQAEHPITKALQTPVQEHRLPQQLFNELIEGYKIKLDTDHLCTEKDLNLYCYRNTGIITILSCFILGQTQQETIAFAHDIGITLEIINLISQFRQSIINKQVLFPLDDLKKYHVESKQLDKLKMATNIKAMLKLQASRARKYYLNALTMLPKKDRKSQRHQLILAKLAMTILDEIESDDFKVFDYEVNLTPIRKFWIAVKTR